MTSEYISTDSLSEFEKAYFEQLGILEEGGIDRRRAERAFERAVVVRDFEIELYWKRASYFWGFQAAFMATIAVLLTGGVKDSWAPLFGCLIALIAFIVSWRWSDMSKGAKFWQNNWERHVDMLEPYFTGALYRLYPAREKLKRPPSVTRVNHSVINSLIFLWLIVYYVLGYAAFGTQPLSDWKTCAWPDIVPFCVLTIFLMLSCCCIKGLDIFFAGAPGLSDQEDITFTNPVVTVPDVAVLHKRKKLGRDRG